MKRVDQEKGFMMRIAPMLDVLMPAKARRAGRGSSGLARPLKRRGGPGDPGAMHGWRCRYSAQHLLASRSANDKEAGVWAPGSLLDPA